MLLYNERPTGQKQQLLDGNTVENKGTLKLILTVVNPGKMEIKLKLSRSCGKQSTEG